MNILVAGNLDGLARALAGQFSKEKIKVVMAGPHARDLDLQLPTVSTYSVELNGPGFRELMSTFKFDAVIYLGTREEQLLAGLPGQSGEVLEGLQATLEFGRETGVKKFFFLSSSEVYGKGDDTSETAEPQPATPNGYFLVAAEQSCRYYSQQFGLNVTVVRVPFVYGPELKSGILSRLLEDCKTGNRVVLPAREDAAVSLLPAAAVGELLLRALDSDAPGWRVVNLSAARPVSLGELAQLLQVQFPGTEITYGQNRQLFTRPLTVSNAKQYYDWLPVDQLATDLPSLAEALEPEPRHGSKWVEGLRTRFPQYPVYLKWAEVFLGALVMMWLTDLTGSFVEFRYVDFRLMYVILIGMMYGTQAGLVASVLACLSVILGARRLGLEWTELVYNIANWLPFAVYLTAGALTGYLQDKKENEAKFQNEQNRLISEKYAYLYGVHQDVVRIKDQYYQQLLGSRDSFGRIYNITQELDTLEEDEVLLNALRILEDVMGSSSIAIYSVNPANHFARLEVYSSALGAQLGRSLNLESFPEIQLCLQKAEIFENRQLLPNYPAYFAPILSSGKPVAAIAIWEAKFEQGSRYYYNLFKVICGLVQSSVHRAIVFLNAAQDKLYLPGTRILKPEPFKRILRVRDAMKKQKTGNYLLATVTAQGSDGRQQDWTSVEQSLSRVIRSVDDVGLLDNGCLCVIFSQADTSDARTLNDRLLQSGLCLEPVSMPLEVLLQEADAAPATHQGRNQQAQQGRHE
jgi:UDP-glucose 4-epimerase